MVLTALGRHAAALPCYEKVLELQPEDPATKEAIQITKAQLGIS